MFQTKVVEEIKRLLYSVTVFRIIVPFLR